MTKRVLSILLALVLALSAVAALAEVQPKAAQAVAINARNFPDKTFRKVLKKVCDKNGDGKLSAKEIMAVRELDLNGDTLQFDLKIKGGITNLKGIEVFTNLRHLDVGNQDLKALDVSKNTKLVSLYCSDNEHLKTLKLGRQKNLDHLWTFFCKKLKKIDIGGCPKLLALMNQYDQTDGAYAFGQPKGGPGISTESMLYSGKKPLIRHKKPTAIAFKKKSVTVTHKQMENHSPYDLGIYLTFKPAGTVWPVAYTTTNPDVITVSEEGDGFWWCDEQIETFQSGATATLTATCGGKKATVRITLK